jgi:hypothetical protein
MHLGADQASSEAGRRARVKWVKRILIAAVVIFAVFYVVTRPQDAANAVEGAVGAVWNAGAALGQFFTSLAT